MPLLMRAIAAAVIATLIISREAPYAICRCCHFDAAAAADAAAMPLLICRSCCRHAAVVAMPPALFRRLMPLSLIATMLMLLPCLMLARRRFSCRYAAARALDMLSALPLLMPVTRATYIDAMLAAMI